ncbi:MAG: hypothetical protein M0Z80_02320, partial [Treponema sp.]|nr:hypothetical protein [Treponema sp.]
MDVKRMALPDTASTFLLLDFPGAAGAGGAAEAGGAAGALGAAGAIGAEPRALLSLRAAGDLRYRHEDGNPSRDGFFRLWGVEPSRVL